MLPIRPLSHLFDIQHDFAAVPDVGWPDIFNSGVLVLSPGVDKFNKLNELLESQGSWDGGDQGLLNEWRAGDWQPLPDARRSPPGVEIPWRGGERLHRRDGDDPARLRRRSA